MRKGIAVICAVAFVVCAEAAERIDFAWNPKPAMAHKALLTENAYALVRHLGYAAISPEVQLPVEVVFKSNNEETGMFGRGWFSPQLESRFATDVDGALWRTPWGEEIRFYAKGKTKPELAEVLKEEMHGKAEMFTPYSDWEVFADGKGGAWRIAGTRSMEGWAFSYRNGRLMEFVSPFGTSVSVVYARDGAVESISANGVKFVEIVSANGVARKVKSSGVEWELSYEEKEITLLPKTVQGRLDLKVKRNFWTCQKNSEMKPVYLGYDEYGYLTKVSQGRFAREYIVQTETPQERMAALKAAQEKKPRPHDKVAGRLIADPDCRYFYRDEKPGWVKLMDRTGYTKTFDFSRETGKLIITDHAGRKTQFSYYMRFDVPYLGKIRQVLDWKGREVAGYRYDNRSGKQIRVRDKLGNDTLFEYDDKQQLAGVSRRASVWRKAQKFLSVESDVKGRPLSISRLDENGNAVQTTKILRNTNGYPIQIDDERMTTSILLSKSGFPVQTTDPFGNKVKYVYDTWNNVASIEDANGVKTVFRRNAAGLIDRVEKQDGRGTFAFVETTYDECGMPVRFVDQDGSVRSFERDEHGRVVRELLPDGALFSFAYNETGQLSSVLDANGGRLAFDWENGALTRMVNGEGQVLGWNRDETTGLLKEAVAIGKGMEKADRKINWEYDKFDRPVKANWDGKDAVCVKYDEWGRVAGITANKRSAEYGYDFFGNIISVKDVEVEEISTFNAYGQRTHRETKYGGKSLVEKRTYDRWGRISSIETKNGRVLYAYDSKGRLKSQKVGGKTILHLYTQNGLPAGKRLIAEDGKEMASVAYWYYRNGKIAGREINGQRQHFMYDKVGRLAQVLDKDSNVLEAYKYDGNGNVLEKQIGKEKTIFAYNRANQLICSTVNGKATCYEYDAAGRMIREGDKRYQYGTFDKVTALLGKEHIDYSYDAIGRLASLKKGKQEETFIWDGIALLERNGDVFLNEPHPSGGTPIMQNNSDVLFSDLLGTTLGVANGNKYSSTHSTLYGEGTSPFFTGKPEIAGLGRSFFLRNYRASNVRWMGADPVGFPDGWNNYAYCKGYPCNAIDTLGASISFGSSHEILGDIYTLNYLGHTFGVQLKGFCNHDYKSPNITAMLDLLTGVSSSATLGVREDGIVEKLDFSYTITTSIQKTWTGVLNEKFVKLTVYIKLELYLSEEDPVTGYTYSKTKVAGSTPVGELKCTISE